MQVFLFNFTCTAGLKVVQTVEQHCLVWISLDT